MSNQTVTTVSSPPDNAVLEKPKVLENGEAQNFPPASAKGTVSEILESVSKATVAGLVLIYACGFVILSISNAEYGFTEVNPLRPKILGAGALFLFLTALPMVTALVYFPTDESQDTKEKRYARNIVAATDYMLKCNLLAVSLGLIYAASVGSTRPWHWWEIAFVFALFISLSHFKDWGKKAYKTYPRRIILIGSALFLLFFVWIGIASDKSSNRFTLNIECWLFGVGLLVVFSRWSSKRVEGKPFFYQWSGYKWMTVPLMMIPMLFYFARVIYPLIAPSWGGGSPTRVIVYFAHESRILPNQQLEADLVDESDSGMYFVKRGEKQAIFVPRQSVSALYFADKPLAPEFLKDAAPTNSNQIPTQPKVQKP